VATWGGRRINAHHVVRDGSVEAGSSYWSLRASRRQALHACLDCALCVCFGGVRREEAGTILPGQN